METAKDRNTPKWKRDLLIRIRNKNKWSAEEQLLAGTPRNSSAAIGVAGQQPSLTCSSAAVPVVNSEGSETWKCNKSSSTCTSTKMVKERVLVDNNQFNNYEVTDDALDNGDNDSVGSTSSEEFHYGPGIVNKLKNRYLSLTLRENNSKTRPSILPIRKATSLEHLLDDDLPNGKLSSHANPRTFQSRWRDNNGRNVSNRYNATRGDLKRARSVETISTNDNQRDEPPVNDVRLKHESLHEDMLIIKEGNDKYSGKIFDNKVVDITTESKPFSNSIPHIVNRPKRITPMMSEKEKPPVDVVKQTKKLFEGRADQRTRPPHQTGEVAAKVATYKTIIGQVRNNKKPPILKQKPILTHDAHKSTCNSSEKSKLKKPSNLSLSVTENGWKNEAKSPSPDVAPISSAANPIPDISRIDSAVGIDEFSSNYKSKTGSNLSETPDLILHSSPVKNASSPTFRILATDNFLKAEIIHSNSLIKNTCSQLNENRPSFNSFNCNSKSSPTEIEEDAFKSISSESRKNIRQTGNTTTYNLSASSGARSHLPTNKETRANSKTATPTLPIKSTHTNGKSLDKVTTNNQLSPTCVSKPLLPTPSNLTPQEIEKNSKNRAKTLEQTVVFSTPLSVKCGGEVRKVEVPKTTLPRESKEQNSIVFKFTDRKDVPDYVGNDGKIRIGKIEKPKVGEGGIILLPGASLDESVTEDDDDWMLSLEGPPSPCDVTFMNDNVLIDGRSSLNQKNKKVKMKLQFDDTVPEIFEYPSEASLLDDLQSSSREVSPGHVVPTLSGSCLANYIPKSGSNDDFQLGITRSVPIPQPVTEAKNEAAYLESPEIEEPVLFSAGTNSDILF